MFFTKLMMQSKKKPLSYVEDESLLYKAENEAWGSRTITISKVSTGENAFTYCGTLPITPTTGWLADIMYYKIGIYRTSAGVWNVRNMSNGQDITVQLQAETEVQPFVVITMHCPDETTQVFNTKSRSRSTGQLSKWYGKTGNWRGGETAVKFNFTRGINELLDLALVYNRVLTDEEIEQNFNAFIQRHRQEQIKESALLNFEEDEADSFYNVQKADDI